MTDFLQLAIQGIALGAVYALIALGFVIVYKATQVINFAQGELVLLGAYLVYAFNQTALPFAVSVALAVVVMAGVGWVIERTILRRMVGKPVFAVVMITIGLAIVIRQIVSAVWGFDDLLLGEPWAAARVQVGALGVNVTSLVTIATAGALLVAFFVFFRFTRAGPARSLSRSSSSSASRARASGCARRRSIRRPRSRWGSRCGACSRRRG